MNVITIVHALNEPGFYEAISAKHSAKLLAKSVDDAVHEAIRFAGLNQNYRNAQGEEWEILIPDETRLKELPDMDVSDREKKWNSVKNEMQLDKWRRGSPRWKALAATEGDPMKARAIKRNTPAGSEGIYYLVPVPKGWRILALRYDELPEMGHPDFWEEAVAEILAKAWHPKLAGKFSTPEQLRAELLDCVYAFPRGRVTLVEGRFTIYHGNNMEKFMKIARSAIEQSFGLQGPVVWSFDDHEQCQDLDKERARVLLQLSADWRAI